MLSHSCHFDERQRGEIFSRYKISRFARNDKKSERLQNKNNKKSGLKMAALIFCFSRLRQISNTLLTISKPCVSLL